MQRLFDYFAGVVLINLPERGDRLAAAAREFEKSRYALSHPASRVLIMPGKRFHDLDGFPSTGMRGSFTSHLRAIELARSLKLKNVVVCEDDVKFNHVDPGTVENILLGIPDAWDIIYFGYLEPKEVAHQPGLFPYSRGTIGGHFYAVNGSFFDALIDYMTSCRDRPPGHPLGGKMGRDATFNQLLIVRPETKVFLASPNLAVQRSSRSNITPTRLDQTFLAPLVNVARSVRNIFDR